MRNYLKIIYNGQFLAETTAAVRTIETSHPPTYYFPPADVDLSMLREGSSRSICEWKGQARYFDIQSGYKEPKRGLGLFASQAILCPD